MSRREVFLSMVMTALSGGITAACLLVEGRGGLKFAMFAATCAVTVLCRVRP